jgi:multidrug efflux pump subunit AcrA (membrane-fusion protein)
MQAELEARRAEEAAALRAREEVRLAEQARREREEAEREAALHAEAERLLREAEVARLAHEAELEAAARAREAEALAREEAVRLDAEQAQAEADPDLPRLSDDAEVSVSIVPVRTTSREFKVEARPKPFEVPPGVEINGDLLRQVRLARGLSLQQLSERTRISVRHLENIEVDRYDVLPVGVYLRGMLMSVARELGLDGLAVSKSYLTFVEARRSKG